MYLERLNVEGEAAKTVAYFIRRTDGTGLVKIGCTSDLISRLDSLSSRRGETLTVLASAPATFRDEATLHKLFADARVHGEWFRYTTELATTIAEVAASGALPSSVKCSARAARLTPSIARVMGLDTAAALLGSRNDLAEALGIQPRSLRHKLTSDRGISNADLVAAAQALEAYAGRIAAHADKLQALANENQHG